jgi:hypothetical protein
MDRSFLSLTPVVQASRRFVCIRPLSYENEEEARYLKSLLVGRSGEMENTTFCFLSADAGRFLSRPARGVQQLFRDAASMAEWMNQTADAETDRKEVTAPAPLPKVPNVRLGINVAAADNQPVVVLQAEGAKDAPRLERELAALAWSPGFIGRLTFTVAARAADLGSVPGAEKALGVLVIQPDRFGQKGTLLARAAETASAEQIAAALREGLKKFRPNPVGGMEHVWEGIQQGVFWETLLPVTDPMEARARERSRRQSGRQ